MPLIKHLQIHSLSLAAVYKEKRRKVKLSILPMEMLMFHDMPGSAHEGLLMWVNQCLERNVLDYEA